MINGRIGDEIVTIVIDTHSLSLRSPRMFAALNECLAFAARCARVYEPKKKMVSMFTKMWPSIGISRLLPSVICPIFISVPSNLSDFHFCMCIIESDLADDVGRNVQHK